MATKGKRRRKKKRSAARPAATRRAARALAGRRAWRNVARWLRRLPGGARLSLGLAAFVVAALAVNWAYQVVRKPSELLFPISEAFYKDPAATWRAYGALFERHSTAVMTPALLAALAQVEGSGNPVVRTYWRFGAAREPFEIYRPASSAVGMFQITNGTFAIARRYCVHQHEVVEVGPWYAWRSCWFNSLYTRTVPSHAVEMTAAYLDRGVADILARSHRSGATLRQRQTLAAMMHLCGAGAGARFARRGFALEQGQQCGAHDARDYIGRVLVLTERFEALAAAG
jgi:hypothetical protein